MAGPRTIGENAMRYLLLALRNSIAARESRIAALEDEPEDRDLLEIERDLYANLRVP